MEQQISLGTLVSLGVLGACLCASVLWQSGAPVWIIAAGYVLGGMAQTLLASLAVYAVSYQRR